MTACASFLFGFAPGETLSEHTSSYPAVLHFLEGEAAVTLGEEAIAAQPGTWVHMPAHLPHSIEALTAVKDALALMIATILNIETRFFYIELKRGECLT